MDKEKLKKCYYNMVQQRYFQQKLLKHGIDAYTEIGEEAITVGMCEALPEGDIISCYFRGEGSTLRYRGGISLKEEMCWWLGTHGEEDYVSATLPSAWTDVEHGVIGVSSSLIGADADVATGVALAQKKLNTGKVTVFVSGDGALSKGNCHEMFNWASLFQLPMLILVRGNGWAMSTPVERNLGVSYIPDLVEPFGIRTYACDGNDVAAVYDTVHEASEYVREGHPALIYAKTYRMSGHSAHDEDDYRDEAVKDEWRKKDPITNAEKMLINAGASEDEINVIACDARKEIDEAYEWAKERPAITLNEYFEKQKSVVDMMWKVG